MVIDARGLRHPEPLEKLREIAPTMCSVDGYVELLIDDEKALKQVKIYAAVSGSTYEVKKLDNYYSIRIEGTCS